MKRLKVGDKVRILKRKSGQENQHPNYVDEMMKFAGETTTISIISGHMIRLDACISWSWNADWLEPINKEHFNKDLFEL